VAEHRNPVYLSPRNSFSFRKPTKLMPKHSVALAIILISASAIANRQSNSPKATLAEADRLAVLYNWPRAIPLYVKAGDEFRAANDKAGEIEARLGWIQAQAYHEPSEALADEVQADLQNPAVRGTPVLMLRCLVAEGVEDSG
jgi:hypothetical protein